MKVKPTRTDSAGNGYYTGDDGKYYYGNAKNGYLTETEAEAKKRLAKASRQSNMSGTGSALGPGAQVVASEMAGGTGILAFLGTIIAFIVGVFAAGITVVIGLIIGMIGAVIAIVGMWVNLSGVVMEIFAVYGVNFATVLITLPVFLCVGVFITLLIRTICKHKYYIWQLLVAYFVLCIPYAVMARGGLEAVANHIVPMGELITQSMNNALAIGALPAIVLFILRKVDMKVQQNQ